MVSLSDGGGSPLADVEQDFDGRSTSWDLMGAAAAGCRTAFVQRPGKALFPGALRPTYVANDLAVLAD